MTGSGPGGLFRRLAGALRPGRGAAPGTPWQPAGAPYPRLSGIAPHAHALAGRGGVYLLWHLGVRPQWIRAGFSPDLGAAAALLAQTPEVTAYGPHDGPFLAWRFCTADAGPGFARFLAARLAPVLQSPPLACDLPLDTATPVPCPLPPGSGEGPPS